MRQKTGGLALWPWLLAGSLCACNPLSSSSTGSYLAQDDHQIDWVQITETTDQHITGSWTRRWFDDKGLDHEVVMTLDGVIDHHQVALRAKIVGPLTPEVPISGEVTWSTLRVIHANGQVEVLQKTGVNDYQQALSKQENQREALATAYAQAQRDEKEAMDQRKALQKRFNDQAQVENAAVAYTHQVEDAIKTTTGHFENFEQEHRNRTADFVNRVRDLQTTIASQLNSSRPNMTLIHQELDQMRRAGDVLRNDYTVTRVKIQEASQEQVERLDKNADFQNWKVACTEPTIRQSDAIKPSDAICQALMEQETKILGLERWRQQRWDDERAFVNDNIATIQKLYQETADRVAQADR